MIAEAARIIVVRSESLLKYKMQTGKGGIATLKNRKFRNAAVLLCLAVLLAYTSVVFLPHAHECVDVYCTVCAMIESSRNLLLGAAFAVFVYILTGFSQMLCNEYICAASSRDKTPVGLRVKLSY